MKYLSLSFILLVSLEIKAQEIQMNWVGRWIEFGSIKFDSLPNPDEILNLYLNNKDVIDAANTDWTIQFHQNGNFEKNDFGSCYGNGYQAQGKWKFESNILTLAFDANPCINETRYEVFDVKWITDDLWYYIIPPDSYRRSYDIVLHKRIFED